MKKAFYLTALALTASLSVAQDEVKPAETPAAEPPAAEVPVAETPAEVPTVETPVAAENVVAEPVVEQPADSAAEQVAEPVAESTAEQPAIEGTKLAGSVQGFLKADASPYLVESSISVEKNSVLIIEPGVTLQFTAEAGLFVEGQLVIAGNKLHNVILRPASADSNSKWKGLFISSDAENEIRNADISGAENGIVVENSNLTLQATSVSKISNYGLYAKNSRVSVNDCSFNENSGVALQVGSYSVADIQRTSFVKNNVALQNALLAQTSVESSKFEENTLGILDMGNSKLSLSNTQVAKNKNGISSKEILDKSVLESIHSNGTNFNSNYQSVISLLPPSPEIPGVQSRAVNANDQIADVAKTTENEVVSKDSTAKPISIIGNVMLGGNYHKVLTRRNHSKESVVVYKDTIKTGEHYKNKFQVPCFGGEASAYVMMKLPNGGTLEFDADLTADSWNHFAPSPISLTYTDETHRGVLGDFQKANGDIYMSMLPVFGANYTLSLLKNNGDQPLFEIDAFVGEAQRSLVVGERHPDMYNDYIDYGEAQAQRQVIGGSFKWSPVRRFDAKFGLLYADDAIVDPILRKGTAKPNVTSDPLQESFTIYADGNWLFYPGDIELNGQIAMGRADTAEVFVERAINKVFQDAGVNASSISSLRQMMVNESDIYRLTSAELEEIFGDNTTMTKAMMRDSLKTLIREANKARKSAINDSDDEKVLGMRWSGQNLAVGASLFWNINKTTIDGHLKYVGENYFSAGSPDLLADTREFGGNIEQIINKFWTLRFGYQINVENAASENNANIFGLGEGTSIGFGSASDSWKKEHELDNDRTKYIQNISLANKIKVNEKVNVNVGYNLEYKTQYRPIRIHGSFALSDQIYKDKWFKKRKGKDFITIYYDGDSTEVDKERWDEYMDMATEAYMGSEFQEKILKHTWNGDVSVRAYKSLFKVGGNWVLRTDHSEFHNDSLMKKFDFANSTWGKLGYYFNGADFFEQAYPLSVTTTLPILQNKVSVTPRFKSYNRDEMSEAEITVEDEIEVPLMNRFMILGANGTFRYLTTNWKQNGKKEGEDEIDVIGNANLHINHTKRLNSEWYLGVLMNYRPDNLFNEYKDIFGGVRVNYAF